MLFVHDITHVRVTDDIYLRLKGLHERSHTHPVRTSFLVPTGKLFSFSKLHTTTNGTDDLPADGRVTPETKHPKRGNRGLYTHQLRLTTRTHETNPFLLIYCKMRKPLLTAFFFVVERYRTTRHPPYTRSHPPPLLPRTPLGQGAATLISPTPSNRRRLSSQNHEHQATACYEYLNPTDSACRRSQPCCVRLHRRHKVFVC